MVCNIKERRLKHNVFKEKQVEEYIYWRLKFSTLRKKGGAKAIGLPDWH